MTVGGALGGTAAAGALEAAAGCDADLLRRVRGSLLVCGVVDSSWAARLPTTEEAAVMAAVVEDENEAAAGRGCLSAARGSRGAETTAARLAGGRGCVTSFSSRI